MAAKKKPVDPTPPKKKTPSPADFRKAEEESKRIYNEKKRNPKDASGNSYFGGKAPMTGKPKTPGYKFPPGTPYRDIKPNPLGPKPDPGVNPKSSPKPTQPTTTTTTPPRGMNQLGKIVVTKSESVAKKKKK